MVLTWIVNDNLKDPLKEQFQCALIIVLDKSFVSFSIKRLALKHYYIHVQESINVQMILRQDSKLVKKILNILKLR